MTRYALIASLILAFASTGAEPVGTGVEMSLALEPATVLPGLPVSFHVTMTNRSSHRIVVPANVQLRVTPADGEAFTARYGYIEDGTIGTWPRGEYGERIALLPNETREIVFPVDTTLMGPEWFGDPRLSHPGSYRLQLIADAQGDDAEPSTTIVSTTATLIVRQPTGEDAKVWTKMQELAGPSGWHTGMHTMNGIAGYVWHEHPTSSYLPYVASVLALSDSAETIRALQAAIELDPHGLRSEWLGVVLASTHVRAAHEAALVHGGDPAAVSAHNEAARTIYSNLLTAKNAAIRRRAEIGLADIAERTQRTR